MKKVNPRIVICTTFRDFSGTENDSIQKLFLASLESQTYKNFELVVTLFGEKKVEEEVKKSSVKSYFYKGNTDGFRYSLTQVVLNGIDYANRKLKDNYILLWTTCDVIYESHFLKTIVENYKSNMIGTSHPHVTAESVEDFREIMNKLSVSAGFDLVYFDALFLQNPKIFYSLQQYVFNDWGIFEHFLISLAKLEKSSTRVNIFEESKVFKIKNDRELTNEPNSFFLKSHEMNRKTFLKFLKENSIEREFLSLAYCHLTFRSTRKPLKHYLWGLRDYLKYNWKRVKGFILSKIT